MDHPRQTDLQEQQRRELAGFLRSRREALTPQEAGVPQPFGRRRAKGLRREELAALAGVSLTWYTWLEQARRIKVSRQVLASLARALKLDPVETDYLFRLAGQLPQPGPEQHVRDARELPGTYLALLRLLDPLPALITNQRFDVLAWNEGLCVLFPWFETLPPEERNVLLMTFDPRTQDLYPEWEDHALHTVALFRAQAADRLVQPSFTRLVAELAERSELFRTLWQGMGVETAHPDRRRFDHPVLGRIELDYVKLHLGDIQATLVTHLPIAQERVLVQLGAMVDERQRAGAAVTTPPLPLLPHGTAGSR
ncbi:MULTISPECIES: helix-turn-helix transcriptional regulator [Streptomycetaceae]|uniref:helix-turn-helix transcriptional regulator n=1 Tax=Streptomycetaceae TaxID=2062 RepID=UPI003008A251